MRIVLMALQALRRHVMRALLAGLAVAVGVAVVITTATLGAGSSVRIEQQIQSVGDDFLWIRAGNRNVAGVRTGAGGAQTLTPEDAPAIAAESPAITACSPRIAGRAQIIHAGENWNTSYYGVDTAFWSIRRLAAANGSLFGNADVADSARVIVLGPATAQELFPNQNPVGQLVRMGIFVFRVVGVLESKGTDTAGLDRDDAVYLPHTAVHISLDRRAYVDDIMCSVTSPDAMVDAERQATDILRARHKLVADAPDDFVIRRPTEFLEMRAGSMETLRWFLIGAGGISFLVGGIGIMNIMLVSVAERRVEIGVRLALGARMRDIRRQFLMEAAAIGLGGGAGGAALGVLTASVLASQMSAPVVVPMDVVWWSVGVALASALVFGWLPAWQGARLEPVEAFRSET